MFRHLEKAYTRLAEQLRAQLPEGASVVGALGSSSFHCSGSEDICRSIGRSLARIGCVALVTGGVSGVGETIGRSFVAERHKLATPEWVFHVLPDAYPPWDYGRTLYAGESMFERREILARMAPVFVIVEGGPGTQHEAETALATGATLIPVGCTGACAAELFQKAAPPPAIPCGSWAALGDPITAEDNVGQAVAGIVKTLLQHVD